MYAKYWPSIVAYMRVAVEAVFQVWRVATGTTMATSTMKVTTVISGQLRQTEQTRGTVN